MSVVLIRYVLMAAMRDRLIWAMAAVMVLGVCLSLFSGMAAILEQGQFVVTYLGGGLRIICLLGLTLFTVFFVRRLYDSRDVEFLLTRPVSRLQFVVSQAAAFSLMALCAGLLLGAIIALFAVRQGDVGGVLLWTAGVTAEFILTVNVAFFFAMVLTSPVSAGMATFGFYILARMMGQLLAITTVANDGGTALGLMNKLLGAVVNVIGFVIPRFDLMAQTSWLVYGIPAQGTPLADFTFIVVQSAAFLVLVLTATYIDLRRRQF